MNLLVFLKIFLSALLPIILFFLVSLIWICVRILKKDYVPNMQRYLMITFISIIFLLHPRLTADSFSLFQCLDVDKDMRVASIDTSIE